MTDIDILQEQVLAIVGAKNFYHNRDSFRIYHQTMEFSAYPGGMIINHGHESGYYDEVETERWFNLAQTQDYATIIAFLNAVAHQEPTS